MNVLRVAQTGCSRSQLPLLRQLINSFKESQNNSACQQVRHMSSKRTMQILPTRFEYTKLKDHLHFYIMLGVIPLAAVTTWANLAIGQAELADIPEDYEPKHWEYYKSPVSRFISKVLHTTPQKDYEINLHYIKLETDKAEMRRTEEKVKKLMRQRDDYKGWYYVPYNAGRIYSGYEEQQELEEAKGSRLF